MQTADSYYLRRAGVNDARRVSNILQNSLREDLVMNWILPETEMYGDYYFILLENLYLKKGQVHLVNDGAGAAMWLPPEVNSHETPLQMLLKILWKARKAAGLKGYWRFYTTTRQEFRG